MNEFYEAIKGFTDIPLALVALVLGILSKRNKKEDWGDLFLLIFMTSIIGTATHTFVLPEILWRALWSVTFAGLFEIDYIFTKLFSNYLNSSVEFNVRRFRYLQLAFCLAAILAVAGFGRKEMMIFVAYSFCCFAHLAKCAFMTSTVHKKAILFISLPLLLMMQAFNTVIPYAVAIEHIALTMILFVLYSISRNKNEGT